MTAKEAYEKAVKHVQIPFGEEGRYFTLLTWKNVGISETVSSGECPLIVTIDGDVAIEVDEDGKFVNSFPAKAQNYFPWLACCGN